MIALSQECYPNYDQGGRGISGIPTTEMFGAVRTMDSIALVVRRLRVCMQGYVGVEPSPAFLHFDLNLRMMYAVLTRVEVKVILLEFLGHSHLVPESMIRDLESVEDCLEDNGEFLDRIIAQWESHVETLKEIEESIKNEG